MVGAGAVLAQMIQDKEFVIAFASNRFSNTDANRGPTEREYMTVLYAVAHFREYLAEILLSLATHCPALTLFFRSSRDLSPKLHRWALKILDYNILRWKKGTHHDMPDVFSRLPRRDASN